MHPGAGNSLGPVQSNCDATATHPATSPSPGPAQSPGQVPPAPAGGFISSEHMFEIRRSGWPLGRGGWCSVDGARQRAETGLRTWPPGARTGRVLRVAEGRGPSEVEPGDLGQTGSLARRISEPLSDSRWGLPPPGQLRGEPPSRRPLPVGGHGMRRRQRRQPTEAALGRHGRAQCGNRHP